MTDLSVLIPPFLMAVAVIVAIVMFLRHEMGRARRNREDRDSDNSAVVQASADKLNDCTASDEDASAVARRDG
jgi:hypothetical protein